MWGAQIWAWNSKSWWWNLHGHYLNTIWMVPLFSYTMYFVLKGFTQKLRTHSKKIYSPIVWYDINIKQDIAQSHIYLTYFLPTSTINTLDIENNTWQSQNVIYQLVDVGELRGMPNNYSQFDELCTMETIKNSLVRPSLYYLVFKVAMHMNLVVTPSHNGVWSETKN